MLYEKKKKKKKKKKKYIVGLLTVCHPSSGSEPLRVCSAK
jgi:hypothetical protein